MDDDDNNDDDDDDDELRIGEKKKSMQQTAFVRWGNKERYAYSTVYVCMYVCMYVRIESAAPLLHAGKASSISLELSTTRKETKQLTELNRMTSFNLT